MAISNHERVGKALDLVKDGLIPFVERELKAQDAQRWLDIARQSVSETQERLFKDGATPQWDAASLLAVLWNQWHVIFKKTLGQAGTRDETNIDDELRRALARCVYVKVILRCASGAEEDGQRLEQRSLAGVVLPDEDRQEFERCDHVAQSTKVLDTNIGHQHRRRIRSGCW